MDFNRLCFLCFLLLCLLPNWASSEFHGSASRSLLQTPTNCPVNFENQNYTIITSKCKGPKYPADLCCSAFKDFACQFVDEIDDTSNNCATTMFSYISLYGKYPPGIFASECHDDKLGLDCQNVTSYNKTTSSKISNSADNVWSLPPFTLVTSCTLALLLFIMI